MSSHRKKKVARPREHMKFVNADWKTRLHNRQDSSIRKSYEHPIPRYLHKMWSNRNVAPPEDAWEGDLQIRRTDYAEWHTPHISLRIIEFAPLQRPIRTKCLAPQQYISRSSSEKKIVASTRRRVVFETGEISCRRRSGWSAEFGIPFSRLNKSFCKIRTVQFCSKMTDLGKFQRGAANENGTTCQRTCASCHRWIQIWISGINVPYILCAVRIRILVFLNRTGG